MADAYLTGSGAYLPGEPLDHDAIAQRLGSAGTGAAWGLAGFVSLSQARRSS